MKPAWVTGVGLWSPGFAGPDPWLGGEPDPAATAPPCREVPSRQRRGTSLTTRMGIEVVCQAARRGGIDLATAAVVFGSAFGEARTAFDQLRMMEENPGGRLSPARFKNSVHNTAIGLLSIAFENRGFSTALAGGDQTFAMSLLEGLLLLDRQGGCAVVGVADDALDEPLCRTPEIRPLGLALALTVERPGEGPVLGRLTGLGRGEGAEPAEVAGAFRHNPSAAGLPLIEALLRGRAGRIPLELGVAEPYSVELRVGEEGP